MTIKQIKHIRSELGWSQAQLADYMNISNALVGQWETGVRKPNEIHTRILNELESRLNRMQSDKKKQKFANDLANLALGGGIIALIVWLFKDEFS